MPRIRKERLTDFGIQLLVRKGVPEDKAAYLAATAVATEAFGIHTHGVVLFAYWDKKIGDEINPAAEAEVVKQTPATALIEGHRGFGALAIKLAREIAIEKAKAQGVAMVAVRNTSWLGALGPHILPIAQAGLLAQLWAQTSDCEDCAPWGGIDGKFSTNPIALAFPTGARPVLSDFSASAISMGRAKAMARAGARAPENLFLDSDGNPTADPGVVKDGGTILFMGGERFGYRGYALALWVEALTAMAGGSARTPEQHCAQAFNLTVIAPDAFGGSDGYVGEIERFLGYMRDSRLRPGFDAMVLPGERAQRAAEEAETRGVHVERALVERLNELAERNGMEKLRSGA